MAFDLDMWLRRWAGKLSWVNLSTPIDEVRALVHVATSLAWSFGFAHAHDWRVSLISGTVWVVYALYKELAVDGHFGRLAAGVESIPEKKDLISDLVTKLVGLVGYLWT
jgi:hypothetical protein